MRENRKLPNNAERKFYSISQQNEEFLKKLVEIFPTGNFTLENLKDLNFNPSTTGHNLHTLCTMSFLTKLPDGSFKISETAKETLKK